MDNLFFDNDIKVNVSQSPNNPIVGDDVIFTATVSIDNSTGTYSEDTSTYFFSYTWLESRDGGSTFYQIGQDLNTLNLYNISSSFFTNIYKVKVSLIDLNNIILTEDGDNLSTQSGEILIGIAGTNQMSIQATSNDTLTTINQSTGETDIVGLTTNDLNIIINEAATFDTTLNDENKAEVYSGQINIDKLNQNSINGLEQLVIPAEQLPDPEIDVSASQMSIQGACQQEASFPSKDVSVACVKVSYFKDCPPCDSQICVTPYVNQIPSITSKNYKLVARGILWDTNEAFYCCNTKIANGTETNCSVCGGVELAKGNCQGDSFTIPPGDSCDQKRWYYEVADTEATNGTDEDLDKGCKCNPRAAWWWQPTENVDFANNKTTVGIKYGAYGIVGVALFGTYNFVIAPLAEWTVIEAFSLSSAFVVGAGAIPVGIAVGAGAVLTMGAYYFFTTTDGKPYKSSFCKKIFQEHVYLFEGGQEVIMPRDNSKYVSGVPAPSYSNCKCGAAKDQSGSISFAKDANNECVYNATKVCGPRGASCYCELDNPNEYSPDVPRQVYFSIPDKAPDNLLFKGSNEYGDCVDTAGVCNTKCVGLNCCGSNMVVYELGDSSTVSGACNEEMPVRNMKVAPCPDSNKPRTLVIVDITARLRACGEAYGNGKYKTQAEASNAAKTIIGKNIGIIFKAKLEKDNDRKSIGKLYNEELFTGAKSVADGYELVNFNCDLCKPAYKATLSGSADYACDDSTSLPCNYSAGCKMSNTSPPTPVSIVTITKIDSPTPQDLADPNVKTTVGEAIEAGIKLIGPNAGLIVSEPCG